MPHSTTTKHDIPYTISFSHQRCMPRRFGNKSRTGCGIAAVHIKVSWRRVCSRSTAHGLILVTSGVTTRPNLPAYSFQSTWIINSRGSPMGRNLSFLSICLKLAQPSGLRGMRQSNLGSAVQDLIALTLTCLMLFRNPSSSGGS